MRGIVWRERLHRCKKAITTAQIDDLSTRLELHRTEQSYILGSDQARFNTEEDLAWTASSLLEWDDCYIDLIDLPTIRPSRLLRHGVSPLS